MDWDLLTREWDRVVDYVKSKFKSGDDSEDEDRESSVLGKGWPGTDGRIAFPPVLQPALARIPKH
jgi:hypothetical protein